MAVAFDAEGASPLVTAGTSFSFDALTVGAGSNRALCLLLTFVSTGAEPSNLTMTWGVQALSLIDSTSNASFVSSMFGTARVTQQLWGLVNPDTGNQTLVGDWTTYQDIIVVADVISVTGASQVGGATTFANAAHGGGTGTTSSQVITSATGNYVVAQHTGGGAEFTSTNNTTIFNSAYLAAIAANRAPGAASVTMTATQTSAQWMAQGVSIAQVASTITASSLTTAVPVLGTPALNLRQLTSVGFTVALPIFSQPSLSISGLSFNATALTVQPPVIGAATVHVTSHLAATALNVSSPVVGVPTLVIPPMPPIAGVIAYRGTDIKEMVTTNINADIDIQVSPGTVVGRTSPGRGLAEAVPISALMMPETYNALSLPDDLPAGTIAQFTNCTTNALGSPVSGSGPYHVLAWYNGLVWTVIGI